MVAVSVAYNGPVPAIGRAVELFEQLSVEGADGCRRVPAEAVEYHTLIKDLEDHALRVLAADKRQLHLNVPVRISNPRIMRLLKLALCIVPDSAFWLVEEALDEITDGDVGLPRERGAGVGTLPDGKRVLWLGPVVAELLVPAALFVTLHEFAHLFGFRNEPATDALVRQWLATYLSPVAYEGRHISAVASGNLMTTLIVLAAQRYEAGERPSNG